MTLLDYGLPLASFAGAGLAWWMFRKADAAVRATARLYVDAKRRCDQAVHFSLHARRYAAVASRAAGLCHDAATQTPANTDSVDDVAVRLLDDSDVFGDGYFRKPDDTAELAVMPPEVC